jgi:excisionase family DNA binding protein
MVDNNIQMLNISKDELRGMIREALKETLTQKTDFEAGNKELLTIEEVCELLSCTRQTLLKRRKKGIIHAYTLTDRGRVYFKRDEILSLIG